MGQQVIMRLKALRGDLAVAQPGEAVAVDVIGELAAVRVGRGLGAVVAEDVGQYLQGGCPGLVGRVASVVQDLGPLAQVVGQVVGGLPGVEQVLLVVGVDERVEGRGRTPGPGPALRSAAGRSWGSSR
jgi:hypothetical protein